MTRRWCTATTKTGEPCKSRPLTDSDHCLAHSDAQTRQALLFVKPRKPPIPTAKDLIEENVGVLLSPYFRALGCELVVDDDGLPRLVRSENGGAKLYGTEQKTGEIRMSEFDDLGAMQSAAERLLDRVYGRPKQQTEMSGPGGGPVQIASVELSRLAVGERRQLLELLEKAGDGSSVG